MDLQKMPTLQKCLDDAWNIYRGESEAPYEKKVSGEYGWLSPSGKFYDVPFGDHQKFASEMCLKIYADGKLTNEEAMAGKSDPGNTLINKNWILIHNPSGSGITVTRNETARITKAQEEYMWEHYHICI